MKAERCTTARFVINTRENLNISFANEKRQSSQEVAELNPIRRIVSPGPGKHAR